MNKWNLKGFSPSLFGEKPCLWQFWLRLMGTLTAFINSSFQEINKVWLQICLQTKTTTSIKKINTTTCPFAFGLFRVYVFSFTFPFFLFFHTYEQYLHCSRTWIHCARVAFGLLRIYAFDFTFPSFFFFFFPAHMNSKCTVHAH